MATIRTSLNMSHSSLPDSFRNTATITQSVLGKTSNVLTIGSTPTALPTGSTGTVGVFAIQHLGTTSIPVNITLTIALNSGEAALMRLKAGTTPTLVTASSSASVNYLLFSN